jgi:hypothetical protein
MSTRRCTCTLAVTLLVAVGCRAPDTVVLVFVDGTTPRPIHQLQVTAVVGGETRSLGVPSDPSGVIFLPTNFSLQIPRDRAGTLTLTVTALDETRAPMVSGMVTIPTLQVGAQNPANVTLGATIQSDASATSDGADDGG